MSCNIMMKTSKSQYSGLELLFLLTKDSLSTVSHSMAIYLTLKLMVSMRSAKHTNMLSKTLIFGDQQTLLQFLSLSMIGSKTNLVPKKTKHIRFY
jgi:hypothetical protein